MRKTQTSISMGLGAPQDWVTTVREKRPLRLAILSWKYHCFHQTRHLVSALHEEPGVLIVKRGPFELVKSVLLRQNICLRKISSVFAALCLSLVITHFPCVDHRKLKEVSVLLSSESIPLMFFGCCANSCTWFSLPQWRSGECEDPQAPEV